MEDVTKNVPTTMKKLCALVHQLTTNSEQMVNLVKRFTPATNQITVDVLISVLKKKKMLNVVVMKVENLLTMERHAKIVRNFELFEYLQKSSLVRYGIFCEVVSVS